MTQDKKYKIPMCIVIAILVIASIYVGISLFFEFHFFPRTFMNGIDVSGKSVKTVEKDIKVQAQDYQLSILERDGSVEVIPGRAIALAVDFDETMSTQIKEQNGFLWPMNLRNTKELSCKPLVSYDVDLLEKMVDSLACMDKSKQIPAIDATISEYSEDKGYTLVESVAGTEILTRTMLYYVKKSVASLATELDLAESGVYTKPRIADNNRKLLQTIDTLNSYLNAEIVYDLGEQRETLDGSIFHEWILVGEDNNVSIDEEAVATYVKELASTYNTCYKAKKLMTSYGQEVTITKSAYGWKIDNEAEKANIIEDILAGEPVFREPNYSMRANSHGENDYGDSYVEINLSAQHLFLYKNGQLIVETDLVSGNVSKGNATPTGAYGIMYKERDATLRGATYESHVSYWMPFNGNVGMHDATWRSSFGKAIYIRNGSHGCVNLPKSAAKTIYENVSAGYPVLVYTLPGTESAAAKAQLEAVDTIDLINKIGNVSLSSESAIATARASYNGLSEAGKGSVTNYQTLLAAEAALQQIKTENGL